MTYIQLGNRNYTAFEALLIMTTPAGNNGLVYLAEHLIAAKMNIRCLNSDPSCIADEIVQADVMIGDLVIPPIGNDFLPFSQTCELAHILRAYNAGELCAPACPDADPQPSPEPCPERPLTPQDLDDMFNTLSGGVESRHARDEALQGVSSSQDLVSGSSAPPAQNLYIGGRHE